MIVLSSGAETLRLQVGGEGGGVKGEGRGGRDEGRGGGRGGRGEGKGGEEEEGRSVFSQNRDLSLMWLEKTRHMIKE